MTAGMYRREEVRLMMIMGCVVGKKVVEKENLRIGLGHYSEVS